VLVLDDFHLISDQDLLSGICEFITDLPPHMHLFLAGHNMLKVPCDKLKASGVAIMIEENDRRFNRREITEFF
jgi:LuxR family maltose regulon positive regulatory protein